MKVIAVILLCQLAISFAFPLDDPAAREERGAFSKSGSEVGPDGRLKSSAIAAKTGPETSGSGQIEPAGMEPNSEGSTSDGPHDDHVSPPMSEGPHDGQLRPPMSNGHHDDQSPPPMLNGHHDGQFSPSVPPHHSTKSFQKVDATANMNTGTAIATATNKRNVGQPTNFQQSHASAGVAIAKTKNNSPTNGLSVQKSQAEGGRLAIATSENGRVFKRDLTKNAQAVKAQGNKAIASALENKGSDLNMQQVAAEGGDLAVAKATSGSSDPSPSRRDIGQAKTLQTVKASGNKAISKATVHSSGPQGTSTQLVQAKGGELGVAEAVNQ